MIPTERLYYSDCYLHSFQARVVAQHSDGHSSFVYLDRTAFYPTSGGQPYDLGTIDGVTVDEVTDDGERILHKVSEPLTAEKVTCSVNWLRRFDHMQQHTGQHLLSAVFADLFGFQTISFHMGADVCTIDLMAPAVDQRSVETAEQRANELITENRAVAIRFEEAATISGLRKDTDRSGTIRVVEIEGLDRSACGGTHVRNTGEIGSILLRGQEKVRGNTRVEFVCGGRAIARSRADYQALVSVSRSFSAAIDNVPALVQAALERTAELEKSQRRLAAELATVRGRRLYEETAPGDKGIRFCRKAGPLDDQIRTEAQSFTAGPQSVFLAWQTSPPSVLVSCSSDLGKHAGNALKRLVAALGGRGGGSATLAQASIPESGDLQQLLSAIEEELLAV